MLDARRVVSKVELRRRIRQDRRQESSVARANRSDELRSFLPELHHYCSGGVAGFQPTNSEPDISPLLQGIIQRSPVYLPRTSGVELQWVAAEPDQLAGDLTGIPDPTGPSAAIGSDVVTKLGVTIILVPALALDPANGIRLGYGAGWYDRLLSAIPRQERPLIVGVCRSVDLLPLPADPHDEPVDALLTEAGLAPIKTR